MTGIYKITCIPNGRFYIGSAVNLDARWRVHRCHLNKGTHHSPKLQASWNKYGEKSFSFSLLKEVPDRWDLISEEQRAMDDERPWFNCCPTAGSSLGISFTSEQRARMSSAQKKASVNGRIPFWKGKTIPESVREKIRKARAKQKNPSGYKWSGEAKERLRETLRNVPGMGQWNKGRKFTEEHRGKLSLSKIGVKRRPRSLEHCRKISEVKKLWWKKIKNKIKPK